MIKTPLTLACLAGLAAAAPALAQEQTRTRTFDGPKTSAVQTTTVNPASGTATRNRTVTNRATGNTATSTAVRQRTETGATINIEQTGPGGAMRTMAGERTRTDNGSSFNGTATNARGEVFGVSGVRTRDGMGGLAASQTVTNSAGDVVGSRSRTTTRSNGQVNHNITRAPARPIRRPR